jgi:hypothetical protein
VLILRPDHGIWLVEACGYLVGDRPIVTYATRACSCHESTALHVGAPSTRGEALWGQRETIRPW